MSRLLIVWLAYLVMFSAAIGLALSVPRQIPQPQPPAAFPAVRYILES